MPTLGTYFPPVEVQEAFHTECSGEREYTRVSSGAQPQNSCNFLKMQACDGWYGLGMG